MKQIRFYFTFISLIISLHYSYSQTIPSSRTVDWSSAGLAATQIEPSVIIDFRSRGGSNNGVTANDSVFTAILNSINQGDSATIFFPNGNYLFNQSLNLRSNVFISGESTDSTILTFNLNGSGDLINLIGSSTNDTSFITSTLPKGSNSLSVNNSNLFNVGDFIRLIDIDTSKVTSTWATGSTGQIVRIIAINGSTLQIDKNLRRAYTINNQPFIRRLNMIENNKIESLTINRMDSTAGSFSNINFVYAYNSKVSCVKSYDCNFSHVEANYSRNIEIEGSYFQHSYGYGSGGRAYGVMLHFTTSDCFVYNNKFNHLRHSMILQAGSNGNVFAYNYSINPFWSGTSLPSDAAGDLVLHGNYVYANLFEGNIVQNLVIDNSHGINGPHNVFFRNRVDNYGIVMNTTDVTDSACFVGNEVTNTGFLKGNYLLAGNGHFEHGNNVIGTVRPSGTNSLSDSSYYFFNAPSYYFSNSIWPPIGIPNAINSNTTEAEVKYNSGALTQCNSAISSQIKKNNNTEANIKIFPNPVENNFKIQSDASLKEIIIYSISGKVIFYSMKHLNYIDLSSFPKGIYLMKAITERDEIYNQKIIKK